MPFSTVYKNDCLYREWSGVCDPEVFDQSISNILTAVDNGQSLTKVLIDFSGVDQFPHNSKTVAEHARNCVALSERLPNSLQVAFVAPQQLVFGFFRMWQAFSTDTGWETQVFVNRQAAEDWLR